MTRRLTVAIIGTVVATVLLVGLGTLALTRFGSRASTERDLRQSVTAIAKNLQLVQQREDQRGTAAVTRRFIEVLFKSAIKARDLRLLDFGPADATADAMPPGVTLADLPLATLRKGATISGHHGSLAYAAAGSPGTGTLTVVVATRRADAGFGPAQKWFVLASGITLVLATLVAISLSRRLTRPLRAADAATREIAKGNLSTRLPEPPAHHADELADLIRSINTMAEDLQRSRGLEQQFLMSISHDLRTPLTSIRGYAEAIADGAASDPRQAATVVLAEARRLERLVRDLLDLSKLDAHRFSFRMGTIDLAEVAGATAAGFRPDSEARGVRININQNGANLVHADPDRLAQVVANLVENGLKYALSSLTVSTTLPGTLTVDDDGPGIATEDLPHVFERLYVSKHQPTRREVGSGLGLAIVRELVEGMGGSVQAADNPNGPGTRMEVRLPVEHAAYATPMPGARSWPPPPPPR